MNDGDGSDPEHDGAPGTGRDGDVGAADRTDGAVEPDGDVGTDVDGRIDADSVAADADDGSEWEFSLEDIQEREADAAAEVEAAERRRRPLEPGDPSLEGVFFVLLGVVLTLFILSRLVVG